MLLGYKSGMSIDLLPYDAEVEYLESTGTQWIDTVVWNPFTTKVTATFSTTVTATQYIFGSYGSAHNFIGTRNASASMQMLPAAGLMSTFGDIHTVTAYNVNRTYYEIIDGTEATISNANSDTTNTLSIFRINGFTTNIFKGRIYRLYLTDIATGQITADYIPVRVGNMGYMYDRVSHRMFGNAGTGDFTVGPDVVPVEYIESHGSEWINTGIFASACDEVELSFAVRTINFRNYIFGCSSQTFGYAEVSNGNKFKTEAASTYNISPLTLYKATFKKSDFSVLVNGTTLDITCGTSSASIFSRDASFAVSCTAPDGRYCGKMLIYGVNLSSDSQTLQNLKPVRVGTEGAMIDTLTRRIYRNQGTGAFTYGSDLPYSILGGGG